MICQYLYSNMKMYTQYQTICSSNYSGTKWDKYWTPPYVCACPKQGHWLQNVICHGFYYVQWLRWEFTVLFVDIGGIVDYHCLNFPSISITYIHNNAKNMDFETLEFLNFIW